MNEPNEAMKALARRIGKTVCERNGLKLEYALAYEAALAAIMETTELAAKYAGWAHMVPPEGGSPTAEETQLAASIAAAIRTGEHYALAGDRHG